jgi:hypothetical protein
MANLKDRLSGTDPGVFDNPNLVSNGGMDVWQRGVDFPASVGQFNADRWWANANTSVKQSNDVPNKFTPFSMEILEPIITGQAPQIYTCVELRNIGGMAPFKANTDYTLSFWAKQPESNQFAVSFNFVDTISDNANEVLIDQQQTEMTEAGVWAKYAVTFNMGAIVPNPTNQAFQLKIIPVIFASAFPWHLALVKLEVGSNATGFRRAGDSLGGELSACQRYYQNSFMGQGTAGGNLAFCFGMLPVQMRQIPALTFRTTPPKIDDIGGGTSIDAGQVVVLSASSSALGLIFELVSPVTGTNCAMNAQASTLNIDADFDQPSQ